MSSIAAMRRVAVCGAGQMGSAAAVCFRRRGYEVLLWAPTSSELEAVQPHLRSLDSWMDANLGPAENPQGTIEPISDPREVDRRADVVLDCVPEVMEVKAQLFRGLPNAVRRGTLFLTATSGLSVTELGRRTGTSALLAGAHFWNPPHLMPLVEVVRGEETPDAIIDRACDLIRSLGKTPVRVQRDVPGFIGNRLLHALWREAIYLVQEGIASPEDIDRVARLTFGLRMPAVGPLENMDLIGLDLVRTIHSYLLANLSDAREPLAELERKVAKGEIGIKSGLGFHDWQRRDPAELIERRDRQIVQQLKFMKEADSKDEK